MAMIDYGSVVKKNGKIIQKESFMDMEEAVGFIIEELPYFYESSQWEGENGEYLEEHMRNKRKMYKENFRINGNFFSYIGDEELLVCIYKTKVVVISNGEIKELFWYGTENSNSGKEYSLRDRKFTRKFKVNGVDFTIRRLFEGDNKFILRFSYKNDLYECVYGYGVDVNKKIWYDVTPKVQRFIDKFFKERK